MSWKRCWTNNNHADSFYCEEDDQIVPDVSRHLHLYSNCKPLGASSPSASSSLSSRSLSSSCNRSTVNRCNTTTTQNDSKLAHSKGSKRSLSPTTNSSASSKPWNRSTLDSASASYRFISNGSLSNSSIFKNKFDTFYEPKFGKYTSDLDVNNFWEEKYAKITVMPAAPGQH